jgi:hypothetical protein
MNLAWRVVGLALLVALAGCGAVSPGDTDAPATTAEATGTDVVTAGQAIDAFDLAESHRDALANDSFTVTSSITVQYANGTAALRQFGHTRLDPDGDGVLTRQTATGSDPTQFGAPFDGVVERWANESGGVYRLTYENGTTELDESRTARVPRVEQATRWEDVAGLLSALDARHVDGEDGDTVVATGSDVQVTYGDPSEVTVTARLSDREHLDSYTVSYRTMRDGTPVQVTRTVRFTNVGETTVEQPFWVEDAQNSS